MAKEVLSRLDFLAESEVGCIQDLYNCEYAIALIGGPDKKYEDIVVPRTGKMERIAFFSAEMDELDCELVLLESFKQLSPEAKRAAYFSLLYRAAAYTGRECQLFCNKKVELKTSDKKIIETHLRNFEGMSSKEFVEYINYHYTKLRR